MSTEKQKFNAEEIVRFVKDRGVSILVRGVLSLGMVVALVALYYAFAPRTESCQQAIAITLETKNGEAVYPNGRLFSSTDLISAPALNRVWREKKLEDSVKFEDFCKWFSLVGYDLERMKLDAEYQTKMSKRNIMVTELSRLQNEYEAKLAALAADNRYKLAMRPTFTMSRDEAVDLLSSVPQAWFDEYVVLNAPTMPSIVRTDVLKKYVTRMKNGDGRVLEMVDALRFYHREIAETCAYVRNHVLRGRNVVIDGVDLGEYEARLDLVRSELLRLKNRILVNGDPADLEGFVAARLDDMACETTVAEEKSNAVRQAIDLLKDAATPGMEGASRSSKNTESGNVTLQADTSFFQDFTAMVRRDANQEAIQKYADELLLYAKELAAIKGRKLYYDQIGQYVARTRNNAQAVASAKTLFEDVEAYASEMMDIGTKVVAFRDRALKTYRTSDQFFALPEPAHYGKVFKLSPLRLALGLLALWAIYNLASLVGAWNASRKR